MAYSIMAVFTIAFLSSDIDGKATFKDHILILALSLIWPISLGFCAGKLFTKLTEERVADEHSYTKNLV